MTNKVDEIVEALLAHKNVLLYGPPGTGKTHLMNEVARRLAARLDDEVNAGILIDTEQELVPIVEKKDINLVSRWVTFHQGYSYEDFILGLRPQSHDGAAFSLAPRPGVLLELAAEAEKKAGLLLIDEINRGNTSRIFGEFITLMEPSKRKGDDGNHSATTVTITLPYLSPGESVPVTTDSGSVVNIPRIFSMPSRIYTLASMNSVDKSISPLDAALRRRFHIINIFPSRTELRISVGLPADDGAPLKPIREIATSDDLARLAIKVLEKLNKNIAMYLGQDYMLGQWYLRPIRGGGGPPDFEILAELWLYRILPQLIELFHGRPDTLGYLLDLTRNGQGSGINLTEPDTESAEAGAMPFVELLDPRPTTSEIIEYLQVYVGAPGSHRASE